MSAEYFDPTGYLSELALIRGTRRSQGRCRALFHRRSTARPAKRFAAGVLHDLAGVIQVFK